MTDSRIPKSVRARIADRAINDAFPSWFISPPGSDGFNLQQLLKASEVKSDPTLPIGIIGAGAAGLCTAMILQKLGKPFEILEARPQTDTNPGAVGGRLFTYYFEQPQQEYDYFDVGAMRFPYIPGMWPTFDMIDWVGLTDQVIPYYFKSETGNTVHYYNGLQGKTPPFLDDFFKVGVQNSGSVPMELANQDAGTFLDGVFGPLAKQVEDAQSFDEAWENIIKPLDLFSTRGYLATLDPIKSFQPPGNQAAITWLETNGFGTNMYNQSCVEALMDYIEFGVPYAYANLENVKVKGPARSPTKPSDYQPDQWYCLLGGTQGLAMAMYEKVKDSVKFGEKVSSIAVAPDSTGVQVTSESGYTPKYYHVISTMSLGCLQTVDLTQAMVSYEQNTAIRCAHYSDSAKVGIKWRSRWWESSSFNIKGGQSYTDRPTRTVVFPSYGIDVQGAPAVMIASYNWSQDASRFGSLMLGKGTPEENDLIKTIISDIAVMHGMTYEELQPEYLDHFAWNWQKDEYTRGAFALFDPGQFYEIFPALTRPAGGGYLHFAGEATSVHHAWISGALASAYRAVAEILIMEGLSPGDAEKKLNEVLTPPNGMRQPEEVNMELLGKQLAYGAFAGHKGLEEAMKAAKL